MQITSIEFAGRIAEGEHLPRVFAKAQRKLGDAFLTVTILTPGGQKVHHVDASSQEDLRSMADCLQEQLDGCRGTSSMVHDYYRELLRLSDL